MKSLTTFLLLAFAFGATAGTLPRVGRAALISTEKSLDDRVTRLWDDNPFVLIGATRGVYLEGYGAVLTAEVNLFTGPTMMMHPALTKDEIAHYRQKRMERLPQLKQALRQALLATAASLDPVPPEEEVVIVIFLSHYSWEDVSGLPVQVTLQAKKKKLLDAQRAGGAGLDQAILISENY
jgi:hypothetical protein